MMPEILINRARVHVQRLIQEHIDGIIALMNREGWYYYDRHELNRYIKLNQDCFTLFMDGYIAGSIFTTNYGNQAWIGNIIIAEEARGEGLAAALIRGVLDYLQEERQIHTFRLGAVPLAIGLYKKLGFHAEAFTSSQEAQLPLEINDQQIDLGDKIQLKTITRDDLEAISEIDARYFKSNRLPLLKEIYRDSIKASCLSLQEQGKIVGFLMIRRRQDSKQQGQFAEGPDYVYRLGPCCVLPKYGINGFKALFQRAIRAVNEEASKLGGNARIYALFPKIAARETIYKETWGLATEMGMDADLNLDSSYDEHEQIFAVKNSIKNDEQCSYMESLGFHQEYFEQVMSYNQSGSAEESKADPAGVFAMATPGDKA